MDNHLEQFFDAYFKLDASGRLLAAWGKTAELLDGAPDELQDQVLWERFPQLAGGELEQQIRKALSSGQLLRVHGQLLPGAGWVEITLRQAEDGVECFVRDVSAYRQTEPGPTHDENGRIIFDALLDHIPEGIIIADAAAQPGHYPFLVVSRYAADNLAIPHQTLLGYTLADMMERVQFFEPGTDIPLTLEEHPLTRFIEKGEKTEDLQYDLRNARGERMGISVKGGPVRVRGGKIIAGIFSWMDTTERKKQQEMLAQYALQLEKSNSDLESFAYTAAHDLQEPLRKVKGFSDLLERKYREQIDSEGLDMLQRIRGAAVRMQEMMNSLLEYSRLNINETERGPVDLNEVLRIVRADLEERIASQAAQVTVSDLPVVHANPTHMQQLFLNLVSNALKFHKPGTAPQVRVYAAGQTQRGDQTWVQIAIEDNGIGFDPHNLERMLQPFQRLHGRAAYEGRGLGLAICQRIVEQLGGTLNARSSPSQGATFLVTLPEEA